MGSRGAGASSGHRNAVNMRQDEGHEVAEQPEAIVAAALRVELDAEQVAAGDGRDKRAAVGRLGGDGVGGLRRRGPGERMNEVEVSGRGDALEQGMRPATLDLVPADVREGRGVDEPAGPPGKYAEGRGPVLVAPLEQQLEPEADPEIRSIVGDPVADRVDPPRPREPLPPPARPPPPRGDQGVGPGGPEVLLRAD